MSHVGLVTSAKPWYGRSGLSDEKLAKLLVDARSLDPKGYAEFCQREYEVAPDGPDFLQAHLFANQSELGPARWQDVYVDLNDFHARQLLREIIDKDRIEDPREYGISRNGLTADFGRFVSEAEKSRLTELCWSYERQNVDCLRHLGWNLLRHGS